MTTKNTNIPTKTNSKESKKEQPAINPQPDLNKLIQDLKPLGLPQIIQTLGQHVLLEMAQSKVSEIIQVVHLNGIDASFEISLIKRA